MVNWSVSKTYKQIQTGIVQFANLRQMRILLRNLIEESASISTSTSNLSEADLFWIELRGFAFLDKVKRGPKVQKIRPNKKNKQHSPNSLKDFTAELDWISISSQLSLGGPCKDATGSNTSSWVAHFGQLVS